MTAKELKIIIVITTQHKRILIAVPFEEYFSSTPACLYSLLRVTVSLVHCDDSAITDDIEHEVVKQ